ncbi:WW domain-containing transcription regulator protein 1 [Sciurus carolinensis]|uniref:WW domain-containing transcription regulator protein 1 n=1 Tax=Sciurus carolinensis TaxID=30640 RepID=A0AA41MK72_SCICA|nr:WW domain-containing transcription regulator protein 1 [Sciurus carolinensis]
MNPSSAPPPLPPPGQQVIHVAQDLDTDLEALFNSVMDPKPSSWRKKVLPESFFQEPDSGSHSRQSSTDSSGGHPGPRLAGGAQHVRSHSSPASLQLGAGAGAAGSRAQQHAHLRQQSYDVTDELPLPPGWEMAFTATGQPYFLNHTEKITTWQDPRKAMNQPLSHMSLHPAVAATPAPPRSMAVSPPNLEEAAVPTAHLMQAFSPFPSSIQSSPVVSGLWSPVEPLPGTRKPCTPVPSLELLSEREVMSHQHQQQMAPNSLSQQSRASQNPAAGLMGMPSALTTQQQQQQKLRLQRIQMERERIRMRQEELMRQEAALCRQLPMEAEMMPAVQAAANPPTMTPDMRSITSNGSDPFLNGGPYHSREQSTDSGLGLGCYSVPTTPEDFLSNVDEMDTGETAGQTPVNINPQQTRFPDFLDCLPGTNVDLGTLESEDLIPLFNDVESALNKRETAGQTPVNINPQQTRFPDFLDCLPGTNVDLGTLESEDLIPLFNDVESALNKRTKPTIFRLYKKLLGISKKNSLKEIGANDRNE